MSIPRTSSVAGLTKKTSGDVRTAPMTERERGTVQIGQRKAPVFHSPLHPVVMMRSSTGATRMKGRPRKASQSAPGTPSFLSFEGSLARSA